MLLFGKMQKFYFNIDLIKLGKLNAKGKVFLFLNAWDEFLIKVYYILFYLFKIEIPLFFFFLMHGLNVI